MAALTLRHWKAVCVVILCGIVAAHLFYNGLRPWSDSESPRVPWPGQGGLAGHWSRVAAKTKSFQSRPELDSSQGGIISKHGHVPLQPDRLHFVEGEDSGDDVIVGAVPYRHDNGVDDDEKKRSRTKRKPRRDPVAADGVPEPEGDLLAEEALLEESVLKDMAPRGVEIKPPRPGETSRKAVYFFEDLEQSDGGMFEEEGDALSVEMEDNRFVDVEEDLNEGNGRISMSQQDLSSADLGKVKDVHTKNEDKDEMIAEIKTGSRNLPSVSQAGSGSGGALNEDVESRGTGHGHAQREETPERGPRPTKLIILTYMRSGSSYVGNLLERSPQVYYLYEPLYSTQVNFGHWGKFRYLDGHNVSESTNPDTNPGGPTNRRKRTRGAPAAYFRSDSIAVRALKSALDCRICDLDLDTMTQVTMGLGVRTVGLRLCAQGGTGEGDLSKVRQCCRNASATCGTTLAVAVKVIRLSMQQARALMEQDEAVKLLHLLRDPRGMSVSQVYRRFYPWEFTREVGHFCSRIWSDLQQHAKLAQEFPFRTLLVRYEDVVRQPVRAMRQIYDFAGIHFGPLIQRQAIERSKDKARPYSWREKIGTERAAVVEKNCAPLFHVMGYREFPDAASVSNRSFVSTDANFADGWPGAVVMVDGQTVEAG